MIDTVATEFQHLVYRAVGEIPYGCVSTYKLLAERIKCGSARAVGQALRCNPFAPEVPCHRVIASDLRVGGFCGNTEGPDIRRKLKLLSEEGVAFVGGRLVDPARVFRFD